MSKLSKSLLGVSLISVLGLAGCTSLGTSNKSTASTDKSKPITVVFYPNESAKSFDGSRTALKKSIEKVTGKTVKLQTTTDYNVAIQAIASGKAQIAYMGANGYIQANHISKDVQPFAAQSDADGGLKNASYNSYLMVQQKDANKYQSNGKYGIKNIKGKKMSYVSNSSTSGFLVPTAEITREFKVKDTDTLTQNGKFFSKVLYGGSHQGSAVNLLKGDVDVAAFDDTDLMPYLKVSKGSWTKLGSTFEVKSNAEAPFGNLKGKKVVNIAMMPVQQGPWVYNTKALSKDDQAKITKEFTSKSFADNKEIFSAPNAKTPKLFPKTSAKSQLVKVNDKWYAPTHKLVGY
ncbi:phosphate/phosphite/phosphonate ABC transporter substrate-binding protein [Lactiplantibacillus mudanjiangensis]|uniref:Phosphonate ABC transporter substrate-binding protein [Lactobacillus sp.] n=1 Tax=Lactiplantibacillus mudanjiangensis TaxID=1296538 RepID=A0A660E7S4_9LACO|nr:phosphate/phosphite/phosphonate ABC transporter substrate-binding protein [Lactiplantibacillus mudanjiangensis]VDG17969.1 phosphonate ABC transporter substrate-binding protein [Lactobacillus sp.] [Lactiplantibacillus mudanjiangensis]VDG24870.1 phosphonate ABC transporter substrate-binding protein [Lactobacillus sp.] [Lactiplantibacillus mudanjiangensis]VDG28386.1 phosphonate ABC transporter substrate-binding protein [Lactobacillus sp.] [Lactiplantibacillus mudanjiangensis]